MNHLKVKNILPVGSGHAVCLLPGKLFDGTQCSQGVELINRKILVIFSAKLFPPQSDVKPLFLFTQSVTHKFISYLKIYKHSNLLLALTVHPLSLQTGLATHSLEWAMAEHFCHEGIQQI